MPKNPEDSGAKFSKSNFNEIKNVGFGKKSSLSENETKQFQNMVKKNILDKSRYSAFITPLKGEMLGEIVDFLSRARMVLTETMSFNSEEKNALKILIRNFDEIEMRKIFFYFAFVTIDYKYFIENKISISTAVENKINFLLGLPNLKMISEDSRKTVLYKIITVLHNYVVHTYNVKIGEIDIANEYLTNLGAILTIGFLDRRVEKSTNSLHIDCIVDHTNPNKNFTFFIPEELANTEDFRNVYDFYFKNEGKAVFESTLKKKTALIDPARNRKLEDSPVMTKKLNERQLEALGQRNKIEGIISHHNDEITKKLSNLKKRNDTVF